MLRTMFPSIRPNFTSYPISGPTRTRTWLSAYLPTGGTKSISAARTSIT
jgi:hypothetical protein